MNLRYKIAIILLLFLVIGGCVSNRQIDKAELACKYDGGLMSYTEWASYPTAKRVVCKNGMEYTI